MQTIIRNTLTKLTAALLLVTAMFSGLTPALAYAACAPTVSFDLWAKTGTATLYTGGPTVNIWGYSDTSAGVATLPGPALGKDADATTPLLADAPIVQGDCVGITLYNVDIPGSTSLLFQGQSIVPDRTGVSAGNSTLYTFTASKPGTFLYEAGLTPNGQHQVAMGLYGALVVRPTGAPLQAYTSASTAFDKEQVLVLSEYDTTLAASPTTFDMRKYAPKYFLINGKAYPGTASIFADAGDAVLLRYVNAGLTSHHMGILGLSQTVVGQDGSPFTYSHKMISETIAPGQTLDAIATIPASAALDTKYALYDSNLMLRNNTGLTTYAGFGGMLTFLTVGTPPPGGPDTTGPLLSSLTLVPNPSNGAVSVALAFTANDTTTGGNTVDAAEYWVDAGAPISIPIGSPATVVTLNATIPAGLSHGTHVVSVRARDSSLNWSATGTINLVVDNMGPTTSGLSLTPNPSNGSVGVTLSFTGNDTASGNSNITAAEYWIDPVGAPANGTGTSVSVASPAPVKTLNVGLLPGLSAGTHVISVHSRDTLGNWGARVTINLVVDQTGPTTTLVTASPNPNNGLMAFNTTVQAVRVTASFSDSASGGSNIAAVEGFIDTIGATGTGFAFSATDGLFNSSNENGYADIPLAVVNALSSGNHTIYVHARDASGNWNNTLPYASTVLTINRSLYFSTLGNTNPPGVAGTADDADVYLWSGTAFSRSIDVSAAPYSLPSGANVDGFDRVDATHFYMSFSSDVTIGALSVQDEDIVYYNAGTWSVYFDGTAAGLTVNNQDIDAFNISGGTLYFSTVGNTNPPGVLGTADDADIYSWNGASFSRVIDVSAVPYSLPAGANVDGFVRVDATHFYLSFATDTTVPGPGTVQDEDVVYFNNGTWIVYFDGTAKGLTNSDHDVDAFDIP